MWHSLWQNTRLAYDQCPLHDDHTYKDSAASHTMALHYHNHCCLPNLARRMSSPFDMKQGNSDFLFRNHKLSVFNYRKDCVYTVYKKIKIVQIWGFITRNTLAGFSVGDPTYEGTQCNLSLSTDNGEWVRPRTLYVCLRDTINWKNSWDVGWGIRNEKGGFKKKFLAQGNYLCNKE